MEIVGTIRSLDKWRQSFSYLQIPTIPLFLEKEIPAQLTNVKPDVVIHTAAMASLSACERDETLAQRINGEAVSELAQWCHSSGCRLIHLSTDIVFKGDQPPYFENSAPDPINAYGRSKLAGEQAVARYTENYVIARIALAQGRGLFPTKNFVDWFLERLNSGQEIPLFCDEIRTPTAVTALADWLWQIALSDEQGIFHLCGEQALNRWQLGQMYCNFLGQGWELLKPISLSDMNDCPRPVDVSFRSIRTVKGQPLIIPKISEYLRDLFK